MEYPEIRNSNLASFLDKKEIIEALKRQIEKDLNMMGIDIHFEPTDGNAYTEILQQIVNQTNTLFKTDTNKLFSILYRVDISEKELSLAGIDLPDYNQAEIFAHSIIKRELKKVLIRKYYKET